MPNTNDLYRITDEAKKPFWHGIIDDLLIDEVLVPVEPDYDEAKDALDLIDAYLSIVRSILGIGETP